MKSVKEVKLRPLLFPSQGKNILPASDIITSKISSLYKVVGPPKMHPDPGLHFQTPPGELSKKAQK